MNKNHEKLRKEYLEKISKFFNSNGEEVLQVKSNEIAIPVLDENRNEEFIVITIRVPTGSKKENEPYDGYGIAKDYELNQKIKKEKEIERLKKKEEKIKKDKEFREKKKALSLNPKP